MDTPPEPEDRGRNAGAQPVGPEEADMWWIIGFVAVCAAIAIVIQRRGSTGASRADDLPSNYQPGMGQGGYVGSGGADGFGGGDGGN